MSLSRYQARPALKFMNERTVKPILIKVTGLRWKCPNCGVKMKFKGQSKKPVRCKNRKDCGVVFK